MLRFTCTMLILTFVLPFVAQAEPPALVVLISVDQLRGDMPLTYRDRLQGGGFDRFFDNGAVYTNAHYGHSMTATAVGHATLATGGNAREHGLIGNGWIDRNTGQSVYCVQDTDHKFLGARTSPASGTSPKNLLAETIGDVLVKETNGKSRIFSVSRKDRSAILLGGHKGKAFWYNGTSGGFLTSTYYYEKYPAWVARWNDQKLADRYTDKSWDLLHDRSTYRYRDQDEREVELSHALLGETFPHSLKGIKGRALYGALTTMPYSDELTIEFAKAILTEEKLGRGDSPDMLMIGLSATDAIGHMWGPASLEAEDNVLRVDAMLGEFFEFVDQHVGLDRTVVILSSDHGVDGNPADNPVGKLDPVHLSDVAKQALTEKFGDDRDYEMRFTAPYMYFMPALLDERADDIQAMESTVAEAVAKITGVAHAIPSHRIESENLGDSGLMQRIERSHHDQLAGNVFIVQEQYYRIFSGAPRMTATHGSPYAYDTHVPVMFFGPGIPHLQTDREVGPENIAATLATLLEIPAPGAATGAPLKEIVNAN